MHQALDARPHERRAAREQLVGGAPPIPGEEEFGLRVQGSDALAFAEWTTDLVADGFTYRLPTPVETKAIMDAGMIDSARQVLWMAENGEACWRAGEVSPVAPVITLVRE